MEEKIKGKLPENAYTPLKEGEKYISYVPAEVIIPEVTKRSVFWGLFMSLLFTASAAYLGLKIGQVFEAAIPIAILAVGLGALYKRKSTISENVIIQSIGAASGVVVAGAIFTLPALYILNLKPTFFQIFLASFLGGCLGVLFLIPLRRYFCKEQHGLLPFPEATATTEILVTGDAEGGSQAKTLLFSAAIGGIYDFLVTGFNFWKEVISTRMVPIGVTIQEKLRLVAKINTLSAVLGLGYIVGLRYSAIICAGSFVSWFLLIPSIWYFGRFINFTIAPGTIPISQMEAEQIFSSYVRHIGIGGIACAGIIGIIKNLKIIISAFSLGFKEIFSKKKIEGEVERTDKDLKMSTILLLIVGILIVTFFFFSLSLKVTLTFAIAALLIATIIAFLFTTVAARAIAIVGTNPVSGMTLMTLIIASFLFVQLGLKGQSGMMITLLIGTIVCTALSVAGGFITDLKIGYWLGTQPRNQERFKFFGIFVAALAIGGVILLLNNTYGFVKTDTSPNPLPAPQANAMSAVLIAMFSPESQAPWALYLAGILLALTMELIGIPPLAFALGMYLPIELNTPLLIGGYISHLVKKSSKDEKESKRRFDKGILISSGFIAGGALMGVVASVVQLIFKGKQRLALGDTIFGDWLGLLLFLGISVLLYFYSIKKDK